MIRHTSEPLLAVAFDMDGLMFDTENVYWKAASALLAKRGFVYTDELCAAVMGRTPQYCFELFKETFSLPETWQELQRESENLFLQFLDDGFSAMPGLFELLDILEAKYIQKCICTSSAIRVVSEVLKQKGLTERFDFILTAEDISFGKPNPEIYLKAAERFGVKPYQMLVLEDSTAGTQAAKAAGCFCAAVRAEHNKNSDLSAANYIASSLNSRYIVELLNGIDKGIQ
ncbi:phosphatase [Planctomycetales bacterium]|nr:phosphatase [Planctomycetales bacterium]GHT36918.1 phosphatase [Planctomycetales bacterium]